MSSIDNFSPRNNDGMDIFVGVLWSLAIICFLMALLVIPVMAYNQNKTFDRWAEACRENQGFVTVWSNDRYECVVDNKKFVVPGYEEYQK